jgi:serine/threonine protein kinase
LRDRYFVEDVIGSGGMGVVFRGHDLELDRPVALKTLLPNRSISRLKREAKILAKIDSPYVVKIHTFVQLTNGLCVLVMELIDGADLSKIMTVNGGQVAEEQALNWMIQTAQGMLAVADKNVTHRDLKPSNILIDRSQQARVADFGLATALTESLGSTTTLTGAIMGTIPYMAPEQTESPDVDTRADIYSFGATFYHALTGRLPFEGATVVTVLVQKHTQVPPAPLKINPSISEHTSRMLERCLARSPEDRFQNFQEVLEFLEQPPPPPNLTCKPLWVYKCRSTSDAAEGDWNYFFEEMDGRGEWGGTWVTRSASSLKSIREKLQVGDLVLAWQTDKRWALGLCRVIALPRDGDEVAIELEAVTRFAQPVKLLDYRDEMPAVRRRNPICSRPSRNDIRSDSSRSSRDSSRLQGKSKDI